MCFMASRGRSLGQKNCSELLPRYENANHGKSCDSARSMSDCVGYFSVNLDRQLLYRQGSTGKRVRPCLPPKEQDVNQSTTGIDSHHWSISYQMHIRAHDPHVKSLLIGRQTSHEHMPPESGILSRRRDETKRNAVMVKDECQKINSNYVGYPY